MPTAMVEDHDEDGARVVDTAEVAADEHADAQ